VKGTTRHASDWVLFAILAAVASWFPAVPTAAAQGPNLQGQDAVYPASGTCCAPSPSFIDASMFASSQRTNICDGWPRLWGSFDSRGCPVQAPLGRGFP
jgi:hypothetical protein